MTDHDWCPTTHFCTRCGASLQGCHEGYRVECNDGVIGMSHIAARRRMKGIVVEQFPEETQAYLWSQCHQMIDGLAEATEKPPIKTEMN
jgi:hypothetical protein